MRHVWWQGAPSPTFRQATGITLLQPGPAANCFVSCSLLPPSQVVLLNKELPKRVVFEYTVTALGRRHANSIMTAFLNACGLRLHVQPGLAPSGADLVSVHGIVLCSRIKRGLFVNNIL